MEAEEVMGTKVICDGLLCSILHSLSGFPNDDELVGVIVRDVSEATILESRRKLFTYFSDEICSNQKKPILDVTRTSVNGNVKDIVTKLVKIDKSSLTNIFCMPWDYKLLPLETDTVRLSKQMEKELGHEVDVKIDALEEKMKQKNDELVDLINNKFKDILQSVMELGTSQNQGAATSHLSYAGATANGLPGQGQSCRVTEVTPRTNSENVFLQPPPPNSFAPLLVQSRRSPGTGSGTWGTQRSSGRGISPSVKRRRGPSGEHTESDTGRERSSSRQKNVVVGTSSTARKMRSPPADIFVYGVHPETSIEDIVADLAENDITIDKKDVECKSRPEAYLKSYKISVKIEDLQKALEPSTWPLRVKVREFVHYARKPSRKQPHDQGQHQTRQGGGGLGGVGHGAQQPVQNIYPQQVYHTQSMQPNFNPQPVNHMGYQPQYQYGHQSQGYRQQGQQIVAQHGEPHGLQGSEMGGGVALTPNKFAMPGDGVPGGVLQV